MHYIKSAGWKNLLFDLVFIVIILVSTLLAYIRSEIYMSVAFGVFLFLYIMKKAQVNKMIENEENSIWVSGIYVIFKFAALTYMAICFVHFYIPKQYYFGSSEAWIGFAGSATAGSLTMLALYFTLQHDKIQKKHELALQSIPLIKVEFGCNMKDFKSSFVTTEEFDKPELIREMYSSFPFQISNSSNFIARNIKVQEIKMYKAPQMYIDYKNGYGDFIADLTEQTQRETEKITTIPGGYTESFFLSFPNIVQKTTSILFESTIEYFDYSLTLKHKVKTQLFVTIESIRKIDKTKKIVEYVYKITRDDVVNRFIE